MSTRRNVIPAFHFGRLMAKTPSVVCFVVKASVASKASIGTCALFISVSSHECPSHHQCIVFIQASLPILDVEFGVCPICAKSFSNKFAMKRHYENVHAGKHYHRPNMQHYQHHHSYSLPLSLSSYLRKMWYQFHVEIRAYWSQSSSAQ